MTAAESASGLPETRLWIYHADRKALAEVPRQRGAEVAANSELAWTADGSKLFVALRSPADDAAAQAAFKAILTGPVVVQSSKPFLDWDAIQRRVVQHSVEGARAARGQYYDVTLLSGPSAPAEPPAAKPSGAIRVLWWCLMLAPVGGVLIFFLIFPVLLTAGAAFVVAVDSIVDRHLTRPQRTVGLSMAVGVIPATLLAAGVAGSLGFFNPPTATERVEESEEARRADSHEA